MMCCVRRRNGGSGRASLASPVRQAHRARVIRYASFVRSLTILMVVLALALRIAIPSGWMPSAEKAFAITVCTGMDIQTVWIDKQGNVHKEAPGKGKGVKHAPCAFAGYNGPVDLPQSRVALTFGPAALETRQFPSSTVSVGHGLAAPPPPAIGPPNLV